MLAGVEITLELLVELVNQVVDPRNRLELYAPQDGALQGLGKGLLDFLCASELVGAEVSGWELGGEAGRPYF